ncbi:MAG: extracellular solute-binding protein, partial [Anaerolineae bacterium]|nr:extracellular solute-binding protein [Anaerolineae bacterium]
MAKLKDETGVTVEWLLNPYDQVLDKLMHLAAAGTPPDTASVPVTHYQTLAKAGALVDIGELIASDPVVGAEDFFLEPLETERSTYQGRWYGIAHGWAFPLLYYNADVFREEGIDPPSADPDEAWTWDHFLEVGRRLTWDAKGKHPGESGFDPGGIERWAVHWYRVWVHLHAAVQSNGGQWVDPITRLLALDQPAASEAIQRVADLTLVDHVLPQSDAVFSQLGM